MASEPNTTDPWQGMSRQERILDAMAEANPDEDGSLSRELERRGVSPQSKPGSPAVRLSRRNRFVQGWRP